MNEKTASHFLNELLALIHRDGGHHQAKVGTAQAYRDACALILKDRERIDELVENNGELDQRLSDNTFHMRALYQRGLTALKLDPDSSSWFDILDRVEQLTNVQCPRCLRPAPLPANWETP